MKKIFKDISSIKPHILSITIYYPHHITSFATTSLEAFPTRSSRAAKAHSKVVPAARLVTNFPEKERKP